MKTIEASFIFPILLMLLANIILFSFELHDKILYKASSYKYMIYEKTLNVPDEDVDLSKLEKYIQEFSLSKNTFFAEFENNCITICSQSSSSVSKYTFYDKCEYLRRAAAAKDIINNFISEEN